MDLILAGFSSVCTVEGFVIMLGGVIAGIIFGAIPGLSTTMAVALFLPVTYGLNPALAMSLLMGLYVGGTSGGLITAVLLGIPGTPTSVATCWDGYPMAAKGESVKALGAGLSFEFLATLFGICALMTLAPPLAKLATKFGPYEYFAIAAFSLTMIATLSSGNMCKGIFSGALGFMFATVGIAPVDAAMRFTFGNSQLSGGLNILPVLIGLFAISELLSMAETARFGSQMIITAPDTRNVKGFGYSLEEFKAQILNFFRSSLIGLGIGILPGVGGGTSNILAYTVAKNQSKYPEKFGTGILDGIVASESASSAGIGGAIIPLLTLGVPGDTVTAVLLGAFTLHGLNPGPLLFTNNAVLVYSIFASLIISSAIMVISIFYGLRFLVRLLDIPKHILMPIIFALCVVGAFGINSRIFDVVTIILFGLIGYMFIVFKIPAAPFILGFILGPMAEISLRRGLQLSRGSLEPFYTTPIPLVFLCLTAFSIFFALWKGYTTARKKSSNKNN
jgi:putative tricarboxylic transport membrane protein